MAWSLHFIGKPHAIKRALGSFGANLSGADQSEFRRAQPTLEALLDLNAISTDALSLSASGQGCVDVKPHSHCAITVILLQSDATHVE